MNKKELEKLLNELGIPVNEGIQSDKNTNVYPRIVFWEYGWDPIVASDEQYNTKVIYQISFFSKVPRDEKLLELKRNLNKKRIFPYIEHEYVAKDKYFHSFFPLEVLENIE